MTNLQRRSILFGLFGAAAAGVGAAVLPTAALALPLAGGGRSPSAMRRPAWRSWLRSWSCARGRGIAAAIAAAIAVGSAGGTGDVGFAAGASRIRRLRPGPSRAAPAAGVTASRTLAPAPLRGKFVSSIRPSRYGKNGFEVIAQQEIQADDQRAALAAGGDAPRLMPKSSVGSGSCRRGRRRSGTAGRRARARTRRADR